MGAPTPTTIPTEPIGSIPRAIDLIERVAKADGDDPVITPINPQIEMAEEVRDRPFEPLKNWQGFGGGGQFLIEARRAFSGWQPDGVTWLP